MLPTPTLPRDGLACTWKNVLPRSSGKRPGCRPLLPPRLEEPRDALTCAQQAFPAQSQLLADCACPGHTPRVLSACLLHSLGFRSGGWVHLRFPSGSPSYLPCSGSFVPMISVSGRSTTRSRDFSLENSIMGKMASKASVSMCTPSLGWVSSSLSAMKTQESSPCGEEVY